MDGIRGSVERTLSSLTLLEEEPWFPFFGGMVSLGDPARWRPQNPTKISLKIRAIEGTFSYM